MSSRLAAIRRQFDRSAASGYDAHAKVQRSMAERLIEAAAPCVEEHHGDRFRLAELGCGTGYVTGQLCRRWPDSTLTAIDLSPAMLAAANRRVAAVSSQQVEYIHDDLEAWAAAADSRSYEVVLSNACFQWLNRPADTVRHLRRIVPQEGVLAFSTFSPATFRELHASFEAAYRELGRGLVRHGLAFQTEEQWRSLLRDAGFAAVRCETITYRERYRSVNEFLHSVKAVGASATESEAAGIGQRTLFATMRKYYESEYRTEDGIYATYEALLFMCQ